MITTVFILTYSSEVAALFPSRDLDLNLDPEGDLLELVTGEEEEEEAPELALTTALRFSANLAKRSRREFSVPGLAVRGGTVVVVVVAAVGRVIGREKAEDDLGFSSLSI